jgi:hypothetical protein
MPHISTEEAKQKKLNGSDTFHSSHIMYLDDLHRDVAAWSLNREAMKAFSESIILTQHENLQAEKEALANFFKENTGDPFGPTMRKLGEFKNFENFKIAAGFELHLKARLIAAGYIVHIIKDAPEYLNLKNEQIKRPIHKTELFGIKGYHFDGRQNYLPGISSNSLAFSSLTKRAQYSKALKISTQALGIIEDYRILRNKIHLPNEPVTAPNIRAFRRPIAEFIVPFVNAEIVEFSNNLIAKYKLNFPSINPLKDVGISGEEKVIMAD